MQEPNAGKNLALEVNGQVFLRYPIKTKLVTQNDKLADIIREFVLTYYQTGDIVVLSERMVAITQGRLIHESAITPSWWSKILIKFVKKWPNDPGFRNAKKMQVVINIVGLPRVLLAAAVSALTKPLGIHGLFYRLCGHGVSEIDGFAPGTIPPYDQYAVLGPENPTQVCNDLAREFNFECAIVDANNIDVAILGASHNLSITLSDLKKSFIDNPIGQGLEQTPICLVRKQNKN